MKNLFEQAIETQLDGIIAMLDGLPLDDKVTALNNIRRRLHEASPFADEPVDFVEWVPNSDVQANDYNPNKVAPPEMRLLKRSIEHDGYTQPIVGHRIESGTEVVDGYHRHKVGKESKKIRERIHGYLPVSHINKSTATEQERIAATIRHNRARGVHGVMPMTNIVQSLAVSGMADTDICTELGMDADELLRFKQNCGLPELFKDSEYSRSWE